MGKGSNTKQIKPMKVMTSTMMTMRMEMKTKMVKKRGEEGICWVFKDENEEEGEDEDVY